MKLEIKLTTKLAPLPAEQELAWQAAMETLATLCIDATQAQPEGEHGAIEEASLAAARSV